jgi:hypothetical protein
MKYLKTWFIQENIPPLQHQCKLVNLSFPLTFISLQMSPAANVNRVVSEQHSQIAIGTTNHILHNSELKDQCVGKYMHTFQC